MVPKHHKKRRFARRGLYRVKHAHLQGAYHYLSQRTTFWVAVLSVFAFVTGNMLGTHGWRVFWASVLGNEPVIAFEGMVPPLPGVPDYERWAKVGGNAREHTFRQLPKDFLLPFPRYRGDASDPRVFLVDNLGTYKTGRGEGSHVGMDIAALQGTPTLAMGNGIVTDVGYDSGGFGNFVVIKHPNVPAPDTAKKTVDLYSAYAHLESTLVSKHEVVRKGQQIGTVGKTGFAMGSHLHVSLEFATAPQHPYWTFTGSEARQAGLTMSQAVDAGLHRERGLQYTTHPLLYVQSYETAPPVMLAQESDESDRKRPPTREERIAQRLARLRTAEAMSSTEMVAMATQAASSASVTVVEQPTLVASDALASADTIVALATSRTVASVLIRHDGSFSGREREHVTLTAVDAQGEIVRDPVFDRTLVLRTAYGRAEFFPPTLTAAHFKNGRAEVEMKPMGEQTVIVHLQPIGSMSAPMIFER